MEKSEYVAWLKKVYFTHGQNWWLFGFEVGEVPYTPKLVKNFRSNYIDTKVVDTIEWKRISDPFVEELTNGLL